MGSNRKIKLLVSEHSRRGERSEGGGGGGGGGKEVEKCHLFSVPRWTQLHEIEHGGKTDLLIEKRSYLILAG